ncbi:MAG: glutamate synthase large subunit, partial [Lysobacter sp.]|nr:glutamate synthase large subunit [Lysobacter sp.]
MQAKQQSPSQQGLYDPRDERDACGFGLIAQLDDRPSRALVDRALEALSRMTHRGGVAADGLSGDGCGLLIRHPDAFLRLIAREANIRPGPHFAAGLVFLPHDPEQATAARDTLNDTLRAEGMRVTGWRVVPINLDACGDLARKTMPRIEQIFVDAAAPFDPAGFQRSLFLARRRAE